MAKTSAAHAALRDWIKADPRRRTNAAIGRAVGATAQAVGRWIGGHVPSGHYRMLLAILIADSTIESESRWLTESGQKLRHAEVLSAIQRTIEARGKFESPEARP